MFSCGHFIFYAFVVRVVFRNRGKHTAFTRLLVQVFQLVINLGRTVVFRIPRMYERLCKPLKQRICLLDFVAPNVGGGFQGVSPKRNLLCDFVHQFFAKRVGGIFGRFRVSLGVVKKGCRLTQQGGEILCNITRCTACKHCSHCARRIVAIRCNCIRKTGDEGQLGQRVKCLCQCIHNYIGVQFFFVYKILISICTRKQRHRGWSQPTQGEGVSADSNGIGLFSQLIIVVCFFVIFARAVQNVHACKPISDKRKGGARKTLSNFVDCLYHINIFAFAFCGSDRIVKTFCKADRGIGQSRFCNVNRSLFERHYGTDRNFSKSIRMFKVRNPICDRGVLTIGCHQGFVQSKFLCFLNQFGIVVNVFLGFNPVCGQVFCKCKSIGGTAEPSVFPFQGFGVEVRNRLNRRKHATEDFSFVFDVLKVAIFPVPGNCFLFFKRCFLCKLFNNRSRSCPGSCTDVVRPHIFVRICLAPYGVCFVSFGFCQRFNNRSVQIYGCRGSAF